MRRGPHAVDVGARGGDDNKMLAWTRHRKHGSLAGHVVVLFVDDTRTWGSVDHR